MIILDSAHFTDSDMPLQKHWRFNKAGFYKQILLTESVGYY